MKLSALALTSLLVSVAMAAPPPAPTITVAATDIKQLQFDISPVPTIGWYELWFRALPGAAWVKYTETPGRRPLFRINAPVHLLDWQQARYYVKACNPSGCTASNEVGVDGEQMPAIGYFKPSTYGPDKYFGFNVVVSADGTTMASVSSERIDGVSGRAAIHVYRKTTSTSGWRLDARLHPSPNNPGSTSVAGDPLALSGDGNTLVFGNWVERSTTGAVYVFRREATGWRQTQRIIGGDQADQFGINVKLDTAGRTLIVGHNMADGHRREGTVEVYEDLEGGSDQFVHLSTVPTPDFADPELGGGWCRALAMSDVGDIVRACFYEGGTLYFTQLFSRRLDEPPYYTQSAQFPGGSGEDVDIDTTGTRVMVQGWNSVFLYRRDPDVWRLEDQINPFIYGLNHSSMSGDGKIVAIGYYDDTLAGLGPVFNPIFGADPTGSVAIFDRRSSGWVLRRYLKAGSDKALHSFGWDVALNHNGNLLAVGSPYDASRAVLIDGDRDDQSYPGRGAVWLY